MKFEISWDKQATNLIKSENCEQLDSKCTKITTHNKIQSYKSWQNRHKSVKNSTNFKKISIKNLRFSSKVPKIRKFKNGRSMQNLSQRLLSQFNTNPIKTRRSSNFRNAHQNLSNWHHIRWSNQSTSPQIHL